MLLTSLPPDESPLSLLDLNFLSLFLLVTNRSTILSETLAISESEAESLQEIPSSYVISDISVLRIERRLALSASKLSSKESRFFKTDRGYGGEDEPFDGADFRIPRFSPGDISGSPEKSQDVSYIFYIHYPDGYCSCSG